MLTNTKQIASNINKWNQVQEVLTGASAAAAPVTRLSALPVNDVLDSVRSDQGITTTQATTTAAVPTSVSVPAVKKPAIPGSAQDSEFEFSDVNALNCLLCSRQFKTLDQLKRHNKESDLHKARIQSSYDSLG